MPELPEVETVVRDLRPLVVGRHITSVRHGSRSLRKPWDAAWNARLVGSRIAGIRRRGKWIVLDAGSPHLLVHLGMTGQSTVVPSAEAERDHVHLVFALEDQNELRFRDIRRFGSATLFPDADALEACFAEACLGPEPFQVDAIYFRNAFRKSTRNLKALLLDQTLLAGVGNIYADESCFRAKLHPQRTGTSLSNAEADRLRAAIEIVLTCAIERRGSTIRDYVGGSGLRGGYQNEFAVYGRTGEACHACGTIIECMRLAGRATHYCGSCQRPGASR